MGKEHNTEGDGQHDVLGLCHSFGFYQPYATSLQLQVDFLSLVTQADYGLSTFYNCYLLFNIKLVYQNSVWVVGREEGRERDFDRKTISNTVSFGTPTDQDCDCSLIRLLNVN